MKGTLPYCFSLLTFLTVPVALSAQNVELQNIETSAEVAEISAVELLAADIVAVQDSLVLSDPEVLFESMPQPEINPRVLNLSLSPKVFSGYQKIIGVPAFSEKKLTYNLEVMTPENGADSVGLVKLTPVGELLENIETANVIANDSSANMVEAVDVPLAEPAEATMLPYIQKYKTPAWLKSAVQNAVAQENILYSYMIDNPMEIEYAYWDLPLPPVLLEEDRSFIAFLLRQDVPDVDPAEAEIPEIEVKKKYWLHNVGALLQFSQAYVSPNWYQGGNNYLSLLFGFNWKVNLNQVYHPNILFQSDLQYKMALTSNPSGSVHKYTIAEDNFQYNLNLGLKAAKEWFYSFNLQFKTQLLNNYESDSYVRTASFLSPGDLNAGIGMSYNHTNKLKTFTFTLTISPLSYNLKTCISDRVNHENYGIPQFKKVKNEVGSNIEFTMDWNLTTNISYKTRVFMFSDYKYYLCDWQNTFNFEINKFLSTQLFVHLRYDGSAESNPKWKKFMLREILSFGLSYTFSTKP